METKTKLTEEQLKAKFEKLSKSENFKTAKNINAENLVNKTIENKTKYRPEFLKTLKQSSDTAKRNFIKDKMYYPACIEILLTAKTSDANKFFQACENLNAIIEKTLQSNNSENYPNYTGKSEFKQNRSKNLQLAYKMLKDYNEK